MKRLATELVFSVATTVVGTLVVLLVQRFRNIGTSTVLALLIIAIVVFINYQSELALFARDRGNWHIPKQLNTTWWFQTAGDKKATIKDSVEIRVIGSYVSGEGTSTSVRGDTDLRSFHYRFKGEIKAEGVLEGRWWTDMKGRNFFGTFQMQLSRGSGVKNQSAVIADGKWIGVSRREGVRTGNWTWYAAGP